MHILGGASVHIKAVGSTPIPHCSDEIGPPSPKFHGKYTGTMGPGNDVMLFADHVTTNFNMLTDSHPGRDAS